jgi:UDP:flavonoid glycosyltransferase YjiC (YdhE family)
LYASERFRILQSPVQLKGLIDTADLMVTYSGHGMVSCCLLSGVPMLMVPTNVEQMLLARCVERLGAGIGMASEQAAERFAAALKTLLTHEVFREAAKKFAEKYKRYDQALVIERVVNSIERLPALARPVHVTTQHDLQPSVAVH